MGMCIAMMVIGMLAAMGLLALCWLLLGRLLLPIPLPLTVFVTGYGDGENLEQGFKALRWLRRSGLWRGKVLILDGGMSRQGLAVAQRLMKDDPVQMDR